MKLAIPVKDAEVAPHLGHCDHFLVADVENGQVTNRQLVANPGHGPGGPPPMFLRQLRVTQIVAWGVPPHAQGLFKQFGIGLVLGATGNAEQVLIEYLAGTLQFTDRDLDAGGSCEDHPKPE